MAQVEGLEVDPMTWWTTFRDQPGVRALRRVAPLTSEEASVVRSETSRDRLERRVLGVQRSIRMRRSH